MSFWVCGITLLLVGIKFFVHDANIEFLEINALFSSALGGAIFIIGFLLAGIITDYKEAEKIPAEFRAALENIWEEGVCFAKNKSSFNLPHHATRIRSVISTFLTGLSHDGQHHELEPCVDAINTLSESFAEMEKLGMPPNYVVRLESEQATLRRIVLRVYHIQRTQFLPSAHILVETLVFGIVTLLLFVRTEGSTETMVLFAFFSYFFLYIRMLIKALEKPFRQGDDTMDDVSLFLIREFKKKLETK